MIALFLFTALALFAEGPRPQEPIPPFPYREEEVQCENHVDQVTLAGTLTLPFGEGPFPTIILIQGSGRVDRNETVHGHKPFLVIADHLTKLGFAVLRMDKRGIGASTGTYDTSSIFDLANDVEVAIHYLTSRADIGKISLVGHSQGGVIAPIVAARCDKVHSIALLAPPGALGEDVCRLQLELILESLETPPDQIAEAKNFQKTLFTILKEESDSMKAEERLIEAFYTHYPDLPREPESVAPVKYINNPWFRHFIVYDPIPILYEVKVPVFLMIGEKDLQVYPKQNIPPIVEALAKSGNPDVTVIELPELNHCFQTSATGSVTEYGDIEETIAPLALETLANWLLKSHGS